MKQSAADKIDWNKIHTRDGVKYRPIKDRKPETGKPYMLWAKAGYWAFFKEHFGSPKHNEYFAEQF